MLRGAVLDATPGNFRNSEIAELFQTNGGIVGREELADRVEVTAAEGETAQGPAGRAARRRLPRAQRARRASPAPVLVGAELRMPIV